MRICVSCGCRAGDRPIERLPVAMSPDIGVCVNCKDKLWRRGVRSGMQRESDRILSTDRTAFTPYLPQPTCKHCGAAVLYNAMGHQPLWCGVCERERMKLATGVS